MTTVYGVKRDTVVQPSNSDKDPPQLTWRCSGCGDKIKEWEEPIDRVHMSDGDVAYLCGCYESRVWLKRWAPELVSDRSDTET